MSRPPDPPQHEPAAASGKSGAAAASRRAEGGPSWLLLAAIALVVMVLVRGLVVQSFYVPSGSMEPTIQPGDRILVNKTVNGDGLRRGDIVVFDGSETFGSGGVSIERTGFVSAVLDGIAFLVGVEIGEEAFVKRVIGLPGDRVVCCDAEGRVSVNDVPVMEHYVAAGDAPSDVSFEAVVPAGRLWVMGDHRSDSSDSRAHRGDAGGGTIPIDDVVGRAASTYWPPSRIGTFSTPEYLADIPRVAAP